MATPALADKLDTTVVNGPQDDDFDWDAVSWRSVEDDVRRLRQRIFKASQEDARRGLLEPDAVKVARPVLRGPGRSNALGLPDNYLTCGPRPRRCSTMSTWCRALGWFR
jgi:hypothetical protein